MFAAILLISSIAGGGVIQLTNAQYEGEELRLNPTGDYYFTSPASDMLLEVKTDSSPSNENSIPIVIKFHIQ